ncbi:PrpF domain-containing protein [Actinoplanes regularis]|uniref:PrpF domain-containing protein n=1 Tax=Actinoplanes regularis TaxID=52697 RepID=UPI002556B531|nr:PrpF domain-containing protein [Actinoplanes regularis]GLW28019.1 hypothetical protein Areg01_09590 [Actinoplanes regularis]
MLVRSGIPVLVMRGGTAKAGYFLAGDLPADPVERDRLLRTLLGAAPVDGIGTGRAVVVGPSTDPDADVDCRFPGEPPDWSQLLAGVGPFAVERELVRAGPGVVPVRVRIPATGTVATVHVPTREGRPEYAGDTAISGVPGTAARVLIEFAPAAGSTLLPTGRVVEEVAGVPVTLIGNGAPVALVAAAALGVTGYETPARLEYDERLRAGLEALRLRAGERLGLGDVSARPEPEICLIAPPGAGGGLCVRLFAPRRVHPSISIGSALAVAAAAALPGSAAAWSRRPAAAGVPRDVLRLELPDGYLDVRAEVSGRAGAARIGGCAVVSTARLLLDGHVFAPSS